MGAHAVAALLSGEDASLVANLRILHLDSNRIGDKGRTSHRDDGLYILMSQHDDGLYSLMSHRDNGLLTISGKFFTDQKVPAAAKFAARCCAIFGTPHEEVFAQQVTKPRLRNSGGGWLLRGKNRLWLAFRIAEKGSEDQQLASGLHAPPASPCQPVSPEHGAPLEK